MVAGVGHPDIEGRTEGGKLSRGCSSWLTSRSGTGEYSAMSKLVSAQARCRGGGEEVGDEKEGRVRKLNRNSKVDALNGE